MKNIDIIIRQSTSNDINHILEVETLAFGYAKEAQLAASILKDPTAQPTLSLLAQAGQHYVGHILFSAVHVGKIEEQLKASILAPLAIVPEFQNQGIGGRLINAGINELKQRDIDLVFVLGHPGYYPKFGFTPAGALGFEAPYPNVADHPEAWMVQELSPEKISTTSGRIQCADSLSKPEHWRE